MEEFRRLGLIEPIVKALEDEKFERPSEIQEKTIPLALSGRDIIAGSATGSGKTLAFGAGIIQNAEKGKGTQALILTPTRELAEQISTSLKKFSRHKPLNVVAIYGGTPIHPQINQLMSADIVVGTPGRILDHIEKRTIRFGELRTLVLDEADRMFDMGFIDDVSKIIQKCPSERQTLLFSATISSDSIYLAEKYMKKPEEISIEQYVDPSKLKQIYYDVPDGLKFSLLAHLLKNEKSDLVMVFCNSRKNTDFVVNNLRLNGISAEGIHGGFSQDKRTKTIKNFHSKKVRVLVCTDVAARGLDVSGVSHVYNYDVPNDANIYVHRIGRTARAGKEGIVINVISSRDYENFSDVVRNHDMEILNEKLPYIQRVQIKVLSRPRNHFRGRR